MLQKEIHISMHRSSPIIIEKPTDRAVIYGIQQNTRFSLLLLLFGRKRPKTKKGREPTMKINPGD